MKTSLFLLSALLFSIAMDAREVFPSWIFIFIFLIPILLCVDKITVLVSNKRLAIKLFFQMFLFVFCSTLLSSYWFLETFPLDWLKVHNIGLSFFIIGIIWAGFSFSLALPMSFWILLVCTLKTRNLFLNSLLGASAWVTLEYLRSWFVAIVTYNTEVLFGPHHTYYALAYSIFNTPFIKEVLPVGGIYLGSFVIILINYFIFYTLFHTKEGRIKILEVATLGSFIIFVSIGSYFYMQFLRASDINKNPTKVFVVNTDVSISKKGSLLSQREKATLDILSKVKDGILIFPENIAHTDSILKMSNADKLDIANKKNRLIIGSSKNGPYFAVFFLDTLNNEVKHYPKQLLMPIGEYSITWVEELITYLDIGEWSKIYKESVGSTQKGKTIFVYKDTENGINISSGICSENISSMLYRQMTKSDAHLLINLASHAPFHRSQLLVRQTVAINTVRALENGRYFITATNGGKSFIINDSGLLIAESEGGVTSYFDATVLARNYITPYVKYGEYVVVLSVLVLCISFIWLPLLRRIN